MEYTIACPKERNKQIFHFTPQLKKKSNCRSKTFPEIIFQKERIISMAIIYIVQNRAITLIKFKDIKMSDARDITKSVYLW